MRLLLIALVACTTDREPPAPVAPATVRGVVTMTFVPGIPAPVREFAPQPVACSIVATPANGSAIRARSDASGAYELSLAPGRYTVEVEACGNECTPARHVVEIASGGVARAGFTCEKYGK